MKLRRLTVFLGGLLVGMILASGLFIVRDAVRSYDELRGRVDRIEGFLNVISQHMEQRQ
jgi:hypothetical protein